MVTYGPSRAEEFSGGDDFDKDFLWHDGILETEEGEEAGTEAVGAEEIDEEEPDEEVQDQNDDDEVGWGLFDEPEAQDEEQLPEEVQAFLGAESAYNVAILVSIGGDENIALAAPTNLLAAYVNINGESTANILQRVYY